jgi:hypothetical protein
MCRITVIQRDFPGIHRTAGLHRSFWKTFKGNILVTKESSDNELQIVVEETIKVLDDLIFKEPPVPQDSHLVCARMPLWKAPKRHAVGVA